MSTKYVPSPRQAVINKMKANLKNLISRMRKLNIKTKTLETVQDDLGRLCLEFTKELKDARRSCTGQERELVEDQANYINELLKSNAELRLENKRLKRQRL